MPQQHTPKQKRKAKHIEHSYEERGVKKKEAKRRAYATVNKQKKSGSSKKGSSKGRSKKR